MYRLKNGKWDYVKTLPKNFIGGDPDVTFRGYLTFPETLRWLWQRSLESSEEVIK